MIIKGNKTRRNKRFLEKKMGKKTLDDFINIMLDVFFYMPHFVIIRFFPTINLFLISYTFLDTDCNGTKQHKYIFVGL